MLPNLARPLLALTAAACSPWDYPDLVDPDTAAVGGVLMSASSLEWGPDALDATKVVTLVNGTSGGVSYTFDRVNEATPRLFRRTDDKVVGFLPPDGRVDVGFALDAVPDDDGRFCATWALQTDTDERLPLSLCAEVHAPEPQLVVQPPPVVPRWCASEGALVVGNDGRAPTLITDAAVEPPFAIELVGDRAVPPGEAVRLPLHFAPTELGVVTATTTVVFGAEHHEADVSARATSNPRVEQTFRSDRHAEANLLLVVDPASSTALSEAAIDTVAPLADALVDRERPVRWRLAAVSAADGCPVGPLPFATGGTPASDLLAHVEGPFDEARPAPDADALLDVAHLAAEQAGPDGCLADWLDADGPVHVVLVSDRDSARSGIAGAVDALAATLARPVSVSLVGELSCGAPYPTRYADAATRTGGVTVDACSPDADAAAATLADRTDTLRQPANVFPLDEPPVPRSMEVWWGRPARLADPATDWTLDGLGVALAGDLARDLNDGVPVAVRYAPAASCE